MKRAFNILLNAATRNLAVAAITEELRQRPRVVASVRTGNPVAYRLSALAIGVVEAIEDKHQAIQASFGSDCGAAFQRRDSEMAVPLGDGRVLERTGRCPLPMHDSLLIAPDLDAEVLHQVMHEVASEHAPAGDLPEAPNLTATIITSGVLPLFHLGVTVSELGRWKCPKAYRNNNNGLTNSTGHM